ncbi:MAG TPA: hypothetical protein VEH47_06180 [Candidatus Acidoferrales bacterium]|nr:hypothetical protein [Candidatus Acidoferrales bacterium]
MNTLLRSLGFIWVLTAVAFAQPQPIPEVGLCQLREHASEFDHKVVTVRGTASLAFEDFTLYDPQCKDSKATTVWLTFGGDVSDVAVYCCGDHSREPGHDLRVDGQPVPLLKDAQYEQFYKLLRASRNRMPNGELCTSDCHFYRVTVTLTGLFLAEKNTKTEHTGYGHLGCCSLLIVEKVSDVTAEKTAVPLGTFDCESSVWKASSKDLPELDSYVRCASNCDARTEALIKRVAAHWNDSPVIANGNMNGTLRDATGPHPVDRLNWISDDLLTGYAMLAEETTPPELSVTRQACRQTGSTPASKLAISCDDYVTAGPPWSSEQKQKFNELIEKSNFAVTEKMVADSAEKLSSQGEQSWRTKPLSAAANAILAREIGRWKIAADPNLRADKCTGPESLPDNTYENASCSWYSPDGTQEFSVDFLRKKDLALSAGSPWLLTNAHARICRFDPSLTAAIIP